MRKDLSLYRSIRAVLVLLLVVGATYLADAQVGAPTAPRRVPNCTGIASVKPLGTTLPVGVNYTVTVTGCNFGSSTGTLRICNQATYGGTCADALGISWSSTSVSGAIRAGALSVGATVYLYVTDASANTNTIGLGPFTLSTGTYWVRTDGSDVNDGTANTAGKAWLTITHAVNAMSAGDFVRVQPGTYAETVTPTVSGTSGNPITLVAGGVVIACSIRFSTNSYIRVIGFKFAPDTGGCSVANETVYGHGTNTGLEFWNDEVLGLAGGGHGYVFDIQDGNGPARCDKCVIVGGSVHDIGTVSTGYTGIHLEGDDNFVGYVDFTTICYIGVGPAGIRSRFVNLTFSGFTQCGGTHPDFFYIAGTSTLGFSNDLIESTFAIGTPTASDNKFHHQQSQSAVTWADNVYRLNVGTNIGSGVYSSYATGTGDVLRTRWYNNTWVLNDRASGGITACGSGRADAGMTVSMFLFNELYYECWSADVSTNVQGTWGYAASAGTLTVAQDCNLGFDPDGSVSFHTEWTSQANPQSNVDPKFNNVGSHDFTIQTTSGAKTTGCKLTTANGNGSSSTSLTVATGDGSYFMGSNASNLTQYSGGLVPGDFITVSSTTVQVSSVSGNVLTLATPISWSNGDPVYFGTSSTVPIGAYPFKAGGYVLSATKLCVAGTCTITPNDASLVRMVVCYNGKVPYTIDNTSPYTCAISSGPFEARVYPRYPSLTRWVVAQ